MEHLFECFLKAMRLISIAAIITDLECLLSAFVLYIVIVCCKVTPSALV